MVHTETKECKQCKRWYVYTNYIDVAWHEEKPYHCIVPKFNNSENDIIRDTSKAILNSHTCDSPKCEQDES